MDRRRLARGLVALLVGSLVLASAGTTLAYEPDAQPDLGSGQVVSPAESRTVVGVQGFHHDGTGNAKKPPRLIGVTRDAGTAWVYDGTNRASWYYDVDPLPGGDLLVTSISRQDTVVLRMDRETRTVEWRERLNIRDTHDVDLLSNGNLVVANMRQYDETTGVSNDRVFVYDRETDTITWEWYFREHYPNGTDGGFNEDWSHVNDVDPVDNGSAFLVSPRNFDQVIKVDRETGDIAWRLGEDEAHGTLFEQHNPDLLSGPNGEPTVLVADSENDRVVEYARRDGEWVRTWTLAGELSWPRDADRLPNGNTLVVDTLNHRIIEVTPTGEVVWEYYATWGPYDAERVATGGGSNGPTMAEQGVTGRYEVTGGESGAVTRIGPGEWLAVRLSGTPVAAQASAFATRWEHVAPWVRPVWMAPWSLAYLAAALLLALGWAGAEAVLARRRIAAAAERAAARLRGAQ
ncbi:MAG: aryl-sulfate sulfotransferase [Haloferacaceae archaeon]